MVAFLVSIRSRLRSTWNVKNGDRSTEEGKDLLWLIVLAHVNHLVGAVGSVPIAEHDAAGVIEHIHEPETVGQYDFELLGMGGHLQRRAPARPAQLNWLGRLGDHVKLEPNRTLHW